MRSSNRRAFANTTSPGLTLRCGLGGRCLHARRLHSDHGNDSGPREPRSDAPVPIHLQSPRGPPAGPDARRSPPGQVGTGAGRPQPASDQSGKPADGTREAAVRIAPARKRHNPAAAPYAAAGAPLRNRPCPFVARLAAALLIVATFQSPLARADEPKVLRLALPDIAILDPQQITDLYSRRVADVIFEGCTSSTTSRRRPRSCRTPRWPCPRSPTAAAPGRSA